MWSLPGETLKITFMEQKTNNGKISSVPIIGIQHEVNAENGEIEVQVEYFALNPEKFSESLLIVEDISLMALLEVVKNGSVLLSDLRSKLSNESPTLESIITNVTARAFFNSMRVAMGSELMDKLVILKGMTTWEEYQINPAIM